MKWYALGVNPEPWAIGDVSVGRRGGKLYPIIGRNNQLETFKQAVAEELAGEPMIEGLIRLRFFFWRNRAAYTTERQRKAQAHDADTTNMQKALEDALQGVLFKNDRDVRDVRSTLVAQGPDIKSAAVIGIEQMTEVDLLGEIPNEVMLKLDALKEEPVFMQLNYDEKPEELF